MVEWVIADLKQRFSFKDKKEALSAVQEILMQEFDVVLSVDYINQGLDRALTSHSPIFRMGLATCVAKLRHNFRKLEDATSANFFSNAKLTRDLLKREGLNDYILAADNGKEQALPFLDFLLALQEPAKKSKKAPNSNLYANIIASSGTGKTQLAATAGLTHDKAITLYLHMGQQDSVKEGGQRFYRAHVSAHSAAFFESIESFLQEKLNSGNGAQSSSKAIRDWAEKEGNDDGSCLFVHFLYRLLLQTEPETSRVKLLDLKRLIRGKKFLVFMDEVPPRKPKDDFARVLCLRDALRYLDIAPILMSTHTGAQDYVGLRSRSTESAWTWVLSRLPAFCRFKANESLFLAPSERPIVLAMAYENPDMKLPQLVQAIRKKLQKVKMNAWTDTPALQLVQLFCTDIDINEKGFASAHKLVGHHFGSLNQVTGESGEKSYTSSEAEVFRECLSVAPVSPKYEPLLYLALTSWDCSMLAPRSETMFPLTDGTGGTPITVRGAYEKCSSLFVGQLPPDNLLALKANGNLLELLVHASCTLVSMRTGSDEVFLPGMRLDEFIALVRHFMVKREVGDLPAPPSLFGDLDYDWPTVPALGGANTRLPQELGKAAKSTVGYLERPKDQSQVDGCVSVDKGQPDVADLDTIMSIECKNYRGGVGATVLKECFKRIKSKVKCCLVFVSCIQDNVFDNHTVAQVRKECFSKRSGVSVLEWNENEDPKFFQIKGKEFKAVGKTHLLVVIVTVGVIGTAWETTRKRRRHDYPPCANFPIASPDA